MIASALVRCFYTVRTFPTGDFQKVAERLHRCAPVGGYYARLWVKGKEVRHILKTTAKVLVKRRLMDKRNDLAKVIGTPGSALT